MSGRNDKLELKYLEKRSNKADSEIVLCPCCNENFTKPNFKKHQARRERTKAQRTCPECKKECKSLYELKTHLNIHKGVTLFECRKCNAIYKHERAFRKHQNEKCGKQRKIPWKCKHCKVVGSNENGFMKHMGRWHKDKCDFSCPRCEEKFATGKLMIKHLRDLHADTNTEVCWKCFHILASKKSHFCKADRGDEILSENENEQEQENENDPGPSDLKLTANSICEEYALLYPVVDNAQKSLNQVKHKCICGSSFWGLIAYANHRRVHILARKEELRVAAIANSHLL